LSRENITAPIGAENGDTGVLEIWEGRNRASIRGGDSMGGEIIPIQEKIKYQGRAEGGERLREE